MRIADTDGGGSGPPLPPRPRLPAHPVARRAADVAPRSINWLWKGRIPFGKLTIIDGDPGLGKSLLTLDLAARLTTGRPMPGDEDEDGGTREPARVIVLNNEDDPGDTIRPRLEAAGADLARVYVMEAVMAGDDGAEAPVGFPEHLAALAELVRAKHARLVIIDPLMAYLDPSVGTHRDQSVRRALLPLKELAQQTGCAETLVRHLHKAPGLSAIYQGGGSIGIIGAARSGLLAAADPVDPDRRLLAPVKSNLAARVPTLAYTVSGEPPTITWLGPVAMTADTLVGAGGEQGGRPTQTAAAGAWLAEALAGGPREARALFEEAEANGYSGAVLRRAAEAARIARTRDGFGRDGYWLWSLPEGPHPAL